MAVDYGVNTSWHDPVSQQGNFWSNYNGSGNYSVHDSSSEDPYPLEPDIDGDGLSEYDEVFEHGTNPFLEDTDGDSYSDDIEIDEGTDPLDPGSNPGVRNYLWIWWVILAIAAGIAAFLFIAVKKGWIKTGKNRDTNLPSDE